MCRPMAASTSVGGLVAQGRQGLVVLDDRLGPADVNEGISEHAGHFLVDLHDDTLGGVARRLGCQRFDSQAHEPVLVGRRAHDHRHVRLDDPLDEQPGDLVQEDGHVVGASVVDRFAIRRTDEQGIVSKVTGHSRSRERIVSQQQHVIELHTL